MRTPIFTAPPSLSHASHQAPLHPPASTPTLCTFLSPHPQEFPDHPSIPYYPVGKHTHPGSDCPRKLISRGVDMLFPPKALNSLHPTPSFTEVPPSSTPNLDTPLPTTLITPLIRLKTTPRRWEP
eukprot:767443-Hanusia_phi.AAC.1